MIVCLDRLRHGARVTCLVTVRRTGFVIGWIYITVLICCMKKMLCDGRVNMAV